MNARHDAGTGLADISYAAFADTDPDPEVAVGFGGQIIGTKNPLAGKRGVLLVRGDILKATFDGGPIVTASTESSSNPNELWTFKTP